MTRFTVPSKFPPVACHWRRAASAIAPPSTTTPTTTTLGYPVFDLLSPSVHDSAVAPRAGGSYCFAGNQALTLTQTPTLSASFSIAINATFSAATTDEYVFAKSTADGSRYYSVYVTATDVRFYYRAVGSFTQFTITWAVAVRDGQPQDGV